jgi:DNA polymerase-3 subunit delta'
MVVGEDGALPLPWLRAPLDALISLRHGHALLLHAAAGDGALELAFALAQAWLCEAPDGEVRPCGRCASCRLVLSKSHPDFLLRVPEALAVAIGSPVRLDERRKPSRQVRIDEVREAIAWTATTAARGRAKVVVLHPAEAMNDAAASALLKTLEEPPAGVRFVLVAADPTRLLPTVRSRCQRATLASPDATIATRWLAAQGVAEPEVLLAGAGGRPLEALQWHRDGIDAARWARVPAAVAQGHAEVLSGWPLARVLDALAKVCHDACVVAHGGAPRFFEPAAMPGRAAPRALLGWQRSLQRVQRDAEHPWFEPLLVDALVAEGHAAFVGARYAPGGRVR